MRFYRILKYQVLIPRNPDLGFWRSTELEVDQLSDRAMCTGYVHKPWLESRSTRRLTDPESLLSGSGPERPAREQFSLVLASIDR